MKTLISALFLLSFVSMFVVYPLYFYYLNEFGKRISLHHSDVWNRLLERTSGTSLGAAYRALRLSRDGNIDGAKLSSETLRIRRSAVFYLYLGMSLFLIVLAIGLGDSVIQGKY
ncbi:MULTISPECIES: hypothetical protein [unclassified Pseudoxanthomonas]|uniref:hypothetical protein n=1 Tax=unclassified Pseudoxanthomonas TaxID=2645906 RepID=UPI0030770AD2